MYASVCMYVYCVCICTFMCMYVFMKECVYKYMYMCIFACLHVTYVCNFLYMYYVCASIKCQQSIRLPVGPSIRLSVCTHIRLSICPSISLCIQSIRLSVRLMYVCMCVMPCQMYEWLCCDCSKTLFPKAGRLNFFYGQLQKPKNF